MDSNNNKKLTLIYWILILFSTAYFLPAFLAPNLLTGNYYAISQEIATSK